MGVVVFSSFDVVVRVLYRVLQKVLHTVQYL